MAEDYGVDEEVKGDVHMINTGGAADGFNPRIGNRAG